MQKDGPFFHLRATKNASLRARKGATLRLVLDLGAMLDGLAWHYQGQAPALYFSQILGLSLSKSPGIYISLLLCAYGRSRTRANRARARVRSETDSAPSLRRTNRTSKDERMGLTTLGFSNPAACQSIRLTSSGVRMI